MMTSSIKAKQINQKKIAEYHRNYIFIQYCFIMNRKK